MTDLGDHVFETIWGDPVWENEGPSSSRYGTATELPPKTQGAKRIGESVKDMFALVGPGEGHVPGPELASETNRWSAAGFTTNLLEGFLLREKTNIVASLPLNVLTARRDHAHGFYRVRGERKTSAELRGPMRTRGAVG